MEVAEADPQVRHRGGRLLVHFVPGDLHLRVIAQRGEQEVGFGCVDLQDSEFGETGFPAGLDEAKSGETGRVVDTEGMVFIWQRGTQTLPVIREALPPGTPKGQRITRRTLAALRLVEASREPAFAEFGILEVDVSKPDFLLATLGNYSKVKIAWDEMDEQTPASRTELRVRLANLQKAIRSQIAPSTTIWNATMPDTVFADTQGRL